jgi:hypothetical protein
MKDFREMTVNENEAKNTDRELWREREGDAYADSIHVTEYGGIGIDCGGSVFVKTLREWHELASEKEPAWKPLEKPTIAELEAILNSEDDRKVDILPNGEVRVSP